MSPARSKAASVREAAPGHRSALEAVAGFFGPLAANTSDEVAAVGWTRPQTPQRLFAAASELFAHEREPFTVYDVGCGLGAFADFLETRFPLAAYSGCDLTAATIERAKRRRPDLAVEIRDIVTDPPEPRDYLVAIGAFNHHHDLDPAMWWEVIKGVIRAMMAAARKGIAVTFLSSRVDFEGPNGRYQDPLAVLQFALDELARTSEIRHGWYPFEFSLLAYHQPRPLMHG